MRISSPPDILVTRGLGSCLGIVIYEPRKKIGGLAHPMLPISRDFKHQTRSAKFVDTVIISMIEKLQEQGCKRSNLSAKLFGGANMFISIPTDSIFNIGVKNIKAARDTLNACSIKIIGEDVGASYGRTIFFELETGVVKITTAFLGRKEI